jgi:PAS domain S-box-containing protein
MKKTPSDPADIAALRRRAEEKLQGKQKGLQKEMDARGEQLEAQRLVHELQVHQIELEMQNDELRRALSEIEESQARYLNLYDFSPTGYFTFDREGRIEAANLTGAQLLGLERGRLIGRRFGLFVSTADRLAFNAFLEKVFASRTKETCEAELSKEKKMPPSTERSGTRRFGETGQIIVHIEAIASENGQECRAVINDITERKRGEEKIQASLLEKETMLKEIQHRVKNNLQVISSLLGLQSSYIQDEKSREIFKESQDRISTMAKIHTMLYQSEDMSRVDFGGFIRDLVGRLQQFYGIAGSPVKIHVNVSDVSLTIETSIPCGLILNELVSNALKHAFPEGNGGEVNISMTTAGDRVVLTVQDNGIGFPEAVDFHNTKSLGFGLVNLLVGQINGIIELQVEGGTTFTTTFPAVIRGRRKTNGKEENHGC